ncbi:MAG: trypsin-like serine peptidase [Planctomycetota bacterium]|jgi:V8-like Glu-specific endopeptidase
MEKFKGYYQHILHSATAWNCVRRMSIMVLAVAVLFTCANNFAQESDEGSEVGSQILPEAIETATSAEDPGLQGNNGGGTVQPDELFDTSESFVPPEELLIVDEYDRELALMKVEDLDRLQKEVEMELEAVSITPEGQVELLPASDEEVEAFMEMLEELAPEEQEALDSDIGGSDLVEDEALAESVIGVDTRRRVHNTKRYPFRTIGRIDIGCTGTLIGPRHVLTAGHCVYNIRTNKWYSRLNFSPGQNGSSRPYGTIKWARAISVKGWTRKHKRNYDYAMIVLKKNVGNSLGWMCYGWKKPMPKYCININGYPADKRPARTMWHSFCKLRIIRSRRLYYPCDTYGGMSGSGVYVYWRSKNRRIIYGIHAYGVDSTGYNGATRITKSVFKNLYRWKRKY